MFVVTMPLLLICTTIFTHASICYHGVGCICESVCLSECTVIELIKCNDTIHTTHGYMQAYVV